MKIQEYKTTTLARPDIVDMLMIEPVEMVPVFDENGNKTGKYEKKVWETATGKTRCKYDVHLVQKSPVDVVQDDGSIVTEYTQNDVIEQITVIDEGKATEEVEFRKKVPAIDTRTTLEKVQMFLPTVPYVRVENLQFDAKELKAEFTGVKDNGNDTVTKERVYGWIDKQGQPQTRTIPDEKIT
jgi:hypothetical protein